MKQRYFNYLLICLFNFLGYSQQGTHLNFDGVDDYVMIPNGGSLNNLQQGTIEAWVKWNGTQDQDALTFGQDYYGAIMSRQFNNVFSNQIIGLDGSNPDTAKIVWAPYGIGTPAITSTISPMNNTWIHIAIVYENGNHKLYLNGVLDGSSTATGTMADNTSIPLTIGGWIGDADCFSNSNIDEVRIWNVIRSDEQINGSKNCELQGSETGLVAYYNFNQGVDQADNSTITTLIDATANANDGTLTNFTLNGATSNWLVGSPVTTGSVVPGNASAATPITYTQGDTASALTATTGTNGSGLLWYTSATGGSGSTSAPTPSTTTVGSTSYWVSSTNANGCESERMEIVVNVNAPIPATHLNFDGTNDYVAISSPYTAYTNEMSVEFWVNRNGNISTGSGIGQSGNTDNMSTNVWIIHGNSNNTFTFYVNEGGAWRDSGASSVIPLNTWTHVAAVADASGVRIYVNGVLSNNTTTGITTSILANPTAQFHIGKDSRYAAGIGRNFNGSFDEVRVWNNARTIEQISGSMNCELQGSESGLVMYYQFNQGNDQSDNNSVTTLNATTGQNGTLTNFTLNGSTSNWLAGSPVTTGSTVPGNPTVTTPVTYNQGDTATALSAAAGTNGTGLMWYTSAAGGTGSTTAPTPSTATVGSTSYWVSSTNANGCESERVEIVVNVNVPNDECANAISLTVGSSSFNDFPENIDLTGATNSGAPTPTCGNFQGGDVWYTVTVPASGNVVIETDGAGLYDTGIEIYTGNCGTLSLVACDDNNGNGNYSKVLLLGQTPGTVYYVRVWENFWGNSNAQFQISAYDYVNPATHLNFDGTNDFVVSANAITNNTENQTFQAWFRVNTLPNNSDRILQRGIDGTGGWSVVLALNTSGRLVGAISATPGGDISIVGTTTVTLDTWYQATLVFENNNSFRIYLNGNLEASTAIGNSILRNSDNRLRVGSGNIAAEYFNGDIDDVRVWNTALSQTDIMNTMNCELDNGETNLMAYYKFNQGFDYADNTSISIANDSSGNNNNGTLTNFSLTGPNSNWASGSAMTTGNTCSTILNSDDFEVEAVSLYPNPTNGVVNIRSNVNLTIEIYDLLGKIILTKKINSGVEDINITNYPSGIYLVKSANEEGISKMYKIIKK